MRNLLLPASDARNVEPVKNGHHAGRDPNRVQQDECQTPIEDKASLKHRTPARIRVSHAAMTVVSSWSKRGLRLQHEHSA